MAKINRQQHKVFGNTGVSSNFAKFGSLEAGAPIKTKDISTIQSLAAWDEGFQEAIFGANKALLMEDLNAFAYEHSLQLGYLLQAGIPEWNTDTEYSIGSFVQRNDGVDATGQVFKSLIDANTGNAPPAAASNANWLYVNPPAYVKGTSALINKIPKITNVAPTTGVAGSKTLSDSNITDDGANIEIAVPLKFPDASIQATAATPITTQSDVTGSRAFNTNYQNTTGKVMWVSATESDLTGGVLTAYTDALPVPVQLVQIEGAGNHGGSSHVMFIVLPGNYYRIDAGGDPLIVWMEWF